MKNSTKLNDIERCLEEIKKNPEKFLSEIQKDLRERRLDSGIALSEIASKTGCTEEEIRGQEDGSAPFSMRIVVVLSLFYDHLNSQK